MTLQDWETGRDLLDDITLLTETLGRVQTGIRVVSQAEDESRFLDMPALQGTLEAAIQADIDTAQTTFDNL